MPSYPELYNLEVTGNPYEARFISLPEEELPPECVLPVVTPFTPLPAFDLTLPDLTCKFDVETPIIPPPYFCTPGISGSVGLSVLLKDKEGICTTDEHPDIEVSGTAGISRVPGTECDYALDGGFSLCMPCIPALEGGITVGAECTINGPNPIQVSVNEPIELAYDEENCLYTLKGNIDICSKCIPEVSYTAETVISGEGTFLSGVSLTVDETGDECTKEIHTTLDLNYSSLDDILAEAEICWLENVDVGSIVAANTIDGMDAPAVTLGFSCSSYDETDPTCCKEQSLSGLISIAACSRIRVQGDELTTLTIPIKLGGTFDEDGILTGGADVGSIKLKYQLSVTECTPETPEEIEEGAESAVNPCCKKVILTVTQPGAALDLDGTALTLCQEDGSTQTICVLLDPRGCS